MAGSTLTDEILKLERQFWEAMLHNDAAAAASLTDEECVIVGAQGVATITGAQLAAMMEHAPYTIERYTLDGQSVQVKAIGDGAALIASG